MQESIIFSAYFTSERDPQRHVYWKANEFKIIQPLYDSVVRLGLNMIIFNDSLSKEFRNEYTTDKIVFETYRPQGKNITTERFLCYFGHMKQNIKYENILCLDCSDLELYKNPFPLIDNKVLIGSEEGLIGDSRWAKGMFLKAYDQVYHEDKPILNCGILGGKYDTLFELLLKFRNKTYRTKANIDMAVFNKLIYDEFKFKTGYPVHTVFTKEEREDSGCYIRHK